MVADKSRDNGLTGSIGKLALAVAGALLVLVLAVLVLGGGC